MYARRLGSLARTGARGEVEVAKNGQRNRRGASAKHTVLWPVVSTAETPPDLTETQFMALEMAGKISLAPEARRILNNIAASWISHDRMLLSPRPFEFRLRLRSIRTSRMLEQISTGSALLHLNGIYIIGC